MTIDRAAITYARIALGVAFLSAVASRLGVWGSGWDSFESYARAEVLAFVPSAAVPLLLGAATVAEVVLGVLLIAGVRTREVALGAAALLATFGTAMAISAGIRSPLEYSVFSASAGAFLLARARPN